MPGFQTPAPAYSAQQQHYQAAPATGWLTAPGSAPRAMQQHGSAPAGVYPGQTLGPATAGAYGPGGFASWPHAGGAALAGGDPAGAQAAAAFLTPMAPGPAAWTASGHKTSGARGLTTAPSAAAAAAGAGRLMYQGMVVPPGPGTAAAGFGEMPTDAGMRSMGLYGQQHMAGQAILDPAMAAGAMYGCPTTTAMAGWPAAVAGNVYGTAADVFAGSAGPGGVPAMPQQLQGFGRTMAGSSTDLMAMLADGAAEAASAQQQQFAAMLHSS